MKITTLPKCLPPGTDQRLVDSEVLSSSEVELNLEQIPDMVLLLSPRTVGLVSGCLQWDHQSLKD